MPIEDLNSHPFAYVKVRDLAAYWAVSPNQVYRQIRSGALEALRFGPRVYRVSTESARRFERSSAVARRAAKQTVARVWFVPNP